VWAARLAEAEWEAGALGILRPIQSQQQQQQQQQQTGAKEKEKDRGSGSVRALVAASLFSALEPASPKEREGGGGRLRRRSSAESMRAAELALAHTHAHAHALPLPHVPAFALDDPPTPRRATMPAPRRSESGPGRAEARTFARSRTDAARGAFELVEAVRPTLGRRRSVSRKKGGGEGAGAHGLYDDADLHGSGLASPHGAGDGAMRGNSDGASIGSGGGGGGGGGDGAPRLRVSSKWLTARAKYTCSVVHDCAPPAGVAYYGLPFFVLRRGERYAVLKEAGHPSAHAELPLYVDGGDDCLLLARDGRGALGWVLASFLYPVDQP
jgi:hypothetical protein